MSCGCSNTSSITTTTNCGSCGYNCSNCTCPTNPIIEPAVVCADPEPCSELFPLECIIYTGPDIKCSATANILYPSVLHYIVFENSSTTARNFVNILNNINVQLCYLFSKDYISEFLTIIQNDTTLKALFCNIASSCNCSCLLTCGTVSSATYNSNSSGIDSITVNFAQVTGGNTKTFSGTISGNILTVTANPGSVVFAAGQKITAGTSITPNTFITGVSGLTLTLSLASPTIASPILITATHVTYQVGIYRLNNNGNYYYINGQTTNFSFPTDLTATASNISVLTANDNTQNESWLVSVKATDQFANTLCTSGYYDSTSNTPVPVSNYNTCGFGQTVAVPVLQCPTICFPKCQSTTDGSGSYCLDRWGSNGTNLTFNFTHVNPGSIYHQVSSYKVHWYKQTQYGANNNFSLNQYKMQAGVSPATATPSSNNQVLTVTTDIPSNTFDNWLLLITPVFVNAPNCGGFEIRLPDPGGVPYNGWELLNTNCNWFIFDKQ